MKRRSFLALLGLSPLAPVAVKAETKREDLPSLTKVFEKHFCSEAQSPTEVNNALRAQMRLAARDIEWKGLSNMELWPNGAPLLVDGRKIKNRRRVF